MKADISWQLSDLLLGVRSVYLHTEPEYPDFSAKKPFKLLASTINKKVETEINSNDIMQAVGLLDATIFSKEQVDYLYAWNFKALASYSKTFCGFVTPTTSIIDLKSIEGFLGIKKKPPENFVEAINRTKVIFQHKGWQKVYKDVHLPLSLRVLPSLETVGLLNELTRDIQYPCYEIEGQVNGRMNCQDKYAHCFLPHTMSSELKHILKPVGYGWRFVCADYRYCEVVVLQWLSGDETLKQILESGEDLHSRIYEIVTKDKCDTANKRASSKRMFLPVMYGCGPKTLAVNLGVGEVVGQNLYTRIQQQFPMVVEWMQTKQEEATRGEVYDYFGRPRRFAENESYKARNFNVQAVAATFCQEKLIDLWKVLNGETAKLVFSVHDGYVMICKLDNAKQTYQLVKDTLEAESKLCPGLKLTVEIKFGGRLDETKVFWK